MDCFNHNCPFRINETSNLHRCECIGCQNRYHGNFTFSWNRTLTKEELDEIKRKLNPNYGDGNWC